ncbi:hypothetical protein ACH4E8_29570 [Streptomyces sp. NPDC017979]|uniref:hypothetical protein n=1 Tax=Streptomyces sp. NPDC017979 TaxID=3365024 RepID=UPI003788BB91
MTNTALAGAHTAPATGPAPLRPRVAQLLAAIHAQGGRWSTGRVQTWRRRTGSPVTQRGTARRDLELLARLGHLDTRGPHDGRHYTLRSSR